MNNLEIQLPGWSLAATVQGAPEAPVLLALHGWLDNAASFHRLAEYMPERRVIALDLPGHGRSAHLPEGPGVHYELADYVAVVLAAADALELPHFDLLGHSLGAGVASLVAATAPSRIRRLALIEGLGPLADQPAETLDRYRKSVTRQQTQRSTSLRTFPDIDSAVAARHQASGLPADLARPIIERGLESIPGGYRWSSDPRLTHTTAVRMAEQQVCTLLGAISCPTWLLLAQPETPYLPEQQINERAACVADIHVGYLAGCHHLHLQHPAQVAARLQAFLR